MANANQITFFACDNGDSVLMEAHGKTIMTDINYRKGRAEDDEDDDAPDFAPDVAAACGDHLNIFVLTHPDKDHLTGFGELFHLGKPEDWDDDPKEGEVKIIVDEMWCSPYSADPNYTTDCSKPVIDEIKRRKALIGTDAGKKDGNRLVIMDTKSHKSGTVVAGVAWDLLAPTPAEATIPKAEKGGARKFLNPSCLVIKWTVTVGNSDNLVLLGADSEVEIWERLHDEVLKKEPGRLNWHILLALHHCSRRAIGRVENRDTKDEKFVPSEKAEAALGNQMGDGHVVASSRRIIRGGNTPPSYDAKLRYLKILANGGTVSDKHRERFLCTSGDADGDKPEHLVFKFSSSGPTKAWKVPPVVAGAAASSGRGGGYGQ